MWCDTFDMDLLKVIPGAIDVLAGVPATVRLRTHGHITDGALNHPECWNTYLGLTAFFTLTLHGDPAPPGYVTTKPIVSCSFVEAVRDAWCHNYVIVVDGLIVWDAQPMWREAFEPLMYHHRRWRISPEDLVHLYEQRVVDGLRAAVDRLRGLLPVGGRS